MAEEKDKPLYDEQPLARLLEAAYVLQEYNRELQKREVSLERKRDKFEEPATPVAAFPQRSASGASAAPALKDDYTATLAQIVEIQRQIQARNMRFEEALSLIAGRVTEIANGGGAAIGIVTGQKISYRPSAGSMTPEAGSALPFEKALCVACLRTGQVIRCADVSSEFLVDVEECQRRGIQSMIAVPIYHAGGIAGGLELYYGSAQAFTEQDVHSCQLMAGLVTEALARDEEAARKKTLDEERRKVLDALEKLKPNLQALVQGRGEKVSATTKTAAPTASDTGAVCQNCGHQFMQGEQFCGNCGTARASDYEPATMQSKVASLWQMQETSKKSASDESANGDRGSQILDQPSDPTNVGPDFRESLPSAERQMQDLMAADSHLDAVPDSPAAHEEAPSQDLRIGHAEVEKNEKDSSEETALVPHGQPWKSAANARDYLEQLAGEAPPASSLGRFWNARRGDIYLAIAVILVAVVIRWGIWSSLSVSATGNPAASAHRKSPDADLSAFDRLLISLGLADAPPVPENKGNPDVQVWVDLHTGLYYCPGTDLYSKTPKGKLTSQRDAQMDSFSPAYGKVCD